MLDKRIPISQDLIEVNQLRMARIRHPMIAHENDIHNVRQIPRDKLKVQVLRKCVNIFESVLYNPAQFINTNER